MLLCCFLHDESLKFGVDSFDFLTTDRYVDIQPRFSFIKRYFDVIVWSVDVWERIVRFQACKSHFIAVGGWKVEWWNKRCFQLG